MGLNTVFDECAALSQQHAPVMLCHAVVCSAKVAGCMHNAALHWVAVCMQLQRQWCGCNHSYEWVDNDTIGALVIPAERGALPERPPVPIGPNVQDNTSGKTSQVPAAHCCWAWNPASTPACNPGFIDCVFSGHCHQR